MGVGNVGEAMVENMTPKERWEATPRPFRYAKLRLYPENQAWLKELIEVTQDEALADLARYRDEGRPESDSDVQECRDDLNQAADILRELNRAMIELAGTPKEE